MIVKGHDFPDVTLVGAIAADLSLNAADYRCAERTFQLLTQAVGRSGRGEKPVRRSYRAIIRITIAFRRLQSRITKLLPGRDGIPYADGLSTGGTYAVCAGIRRR